MSSTSPLHPSIVSRPHPASEQDIRILSGEAIVPESAVAVYRDAMHALQAHELRFLVGGAHALANYTGITRHTKDLDLFVKGEDISRMLAVLDRAGFVTELTSPMWLAKAFRGDDFVDLIFNSSNGLCHVDDFWFDRARPAHIFDTDVLLSAPEEIIWTKAFIMERERYDGADIAHLLRSCAGELDWDRLVRLFNGHWRLLLSNLVLFEFIYPSEGHLIPDEIVDTLLDRLCTDRASSEPRPRLCRGTLVSRTQYVPDLRHFDYQDARIRPHGRMTPDEAAVLSHLELEDPGEARQLLASLTEGRESDGE